ncbi:MAG: preprotein translocase subunit SecA [Oscillospiraceae bacterium]|jgi:preprotein translocase subunit SecA|nr:preprotein translocase subunit SecA [Oscillospiraceae bacterium]
MGLMKKLFGSHSDRELKKIYPIADKVMALDETYGKLTDEELKGKTPEFKARLAAGETLDDILPEAFAAAREAAWRVLGMKPYRVQIIGGIVLHQGRIAEMRTGEGKTLVAVLPAYLNALTGEGVHIVTVNDYLAKRDSEWMGKVYRFMGLSVGLIIHDVDPIDRQRAYAADITYGTNNEMGFDYLRDNMAIYKQQVVQRGHAFAIVDEVDSILIDEARTPLIISGQGDESTDLYRLAEDFVSRLKCKVYSSIDTKAEEDENLDADYIVDEKAKTATLTGQGVKKAEAAFGLENLSDIENSTLYHHINQALRAHGIMKRDIDYVVKDGEVLIVDEFTGRIMLGRRYSEGLHQAIEAKEHVDVQRENKTLATITFQNYFRLYGKLSGMTGTAMTEEEEFAAIYKLDIIEIPTNKPVARQDHPDVIYKTDEAKYRAVVRQIIECHEKGQPVLVGTVSIEKSELVSALLKKQGVPHNVLNAKHHEKEAEIVAQAGKFGAVTIATNMAGRGTDIMLGGNAEYLAKQALRKAGYEEKVIAEATGYADTDNADILAARKLYAESMDQHKAEIAEEAERVRSVGGLFIVGTERHEARRIDNQLRGRAGRQGDPGESRFFISMNDDVMRLFGTDRVKAMMDALKVDEDMPLENKTLTNALETAQKTVESRHFQSRKSVLEFDDVMNQQRNLIYDQRRKVLDGEDLSDSVSGMIVDYVSSTIKDGMGGLPIESQSQLTEILKPFEQLFLRRGDIQVPDGELPHLTADHLEDLVLEKADMVYAAREAAFGPMPDGTPIMRELERVVMLRVVDEYWMEHIDAMSDLKDGIRLRAYANEKPIDAYKKEGYEMFDAMVAGIREETVRRMFTVQLRQNAAPERKSVAKATGTGGDGTVKKNPVKKLKKPGRNDPCPCGKLRPNGLPMKYKDCCGKND